MRNVPVTFFFHNFQFIHFAIVAALDQMLIANAQESSDWMSERVFFVCLTFLVDYIYLSIRLVLIRCIMTLFSFQRKISTFFPLLFRVIHQNCLRSRNVIRKMCVRVTDNHAQQSSAFS